MTHQQMIDYWQEQINLNERAAKILSTTLQIEVAKAKAESARIIYMQLCTMKFDAPAIEINTSYEIAKPGNFETSNSARPCDHNFDITGILGFRCIKCGAFPGDLPNSKSSQP